MAKAMASHSVLRGQAVAAPDASALHVAGGDARGHELVLHIGVAEACGHVKLICHTPGEEGTILSHRLRVHCASGGEDSEMDQNPGNSCSP